MLQRYRRVTEVEAFQIPAEDTLDTADDWACLEHWLDGMTGGTYEVHPFMPMTLDAGDHAPRDKTDRYSDGLSITTQGGHPVYGEPGDWVIKHANGSFEIVPERTFQDQFEPLEESAAGESPDESGASSDGTAASESSTGSSPSLAGASEKPAPDSAVTD